MTFLLGTIYPSALVIISLPSPIHFIVCLPDFRHFPAVVVREAYKKQKIDSTIKRQLSGNSSLTFQTAAS